jgi:hypothetical protein
MSLELISQLYVAPEKTKVEKYRRFKNESTKRQPGVKRTQAQRIITTKWEPEIAKKRTTKIGRRRAREDKYGNWNENRTTCRLEDDINENNNDMQREKLRVASLERRGIYQRTPSSVFADMSDLMFPVYNLANKDTWPTSAWESYYEMKDMEEEIRCDAETRLLIKPGTIVGFREPVPFKWEQGMSAEEWTTEFWRRVDENEHVLTGNGLREDDEFEYIDL